LGEQSVNVGVVDIGTNSMRLLITSGSTEVGRWVEVTGLGAGVDVNHRLSEDAILRTLEVFSTFGELMDLHDVRVRKAIATSASRDADNRDEFFDRCQELLGVRPILISGAEEARYAYAGAIGDTDTTSEIVVSDIGGGSTEFVNHDRMVSVDIGSVRLTERSLNDRPASPAQLESARFLVTDLIETVDFSPDSVVGVAGTWTSLAAMAQDLERYDPRRVQGYELNRNQLSKMVSDLAGLTIRQTESIPSLDPKRAPVILAGAVVAECVLIRLGMDQAKISERDTLDGVASELLALR
jgi:exopolyphosphatase/guanosine-5'-triphosphate,3'-diphosphate pyrophosphatase